MQAAAFLSEIKTIRGAGSPWQICKVISQPTCSVFLARFRATKAALDVMGIHRGVDRV